MNTRRNAARRLEEEIANVGDPRRVNQAPVNPPPLMDEDIRAPLIQLAKAATVQAQDMTAQANRDVTRCPL